GRNLAITSILVLVVLFLLTKLAADFLDMVFGVKSLVRLSMANFHLDAMTLESGSSLDAQVVGHHLGPCATMS
ncbi:hypothetical protein Q6247_26620, partial [Klebsiella pneumoniae]